MAAQLDVCRLGLWSTKGVKSAVGSFVFVLRSYAPEELFSYPPPLSPSSLNRLNSPTKPSPTPAPGRSRCACALPSSDISTSPSTAPRSLPLDAFSLAVICLCCVSRNSLSKFVHCDSPIKKARLGWTQSGSRKTSRRHPHRSFSRATGRTMMLKNWPTYIKNSPCCQTA